MIFVGLIVIATEGLSPTRDDALISQIGVFARAHDLRGLRGVESRIVRSHSRRVTSMYFIGRHFADPAADHAFVRDFPTDIESITDMYALTPAVTGRHGTYAFNELALLAGRGERDAIEKLIDVVSNSDGAVGEFAADRLSAVARSRPLTMLRVLLNLPTPTLNRVVRNPLPWCDSLPKLQGVAPESSSMRRLQARIQVSAMRC